MDNIIVIHRGVKDTPLLKSAIHPESTCIDYQDYTLLDASSSVSLLPTEKNFAYLEENDINQRVVYFDISDILCHVTPTTAHIAFIYEYPGSCVVPFFPNREAPFTSRYNYHYFSDRMVDLLHELREKCHGDITVDLLSCDLNHPTFITEVNRLQIDTGITIRYSLDKTGGPPIGDWILESDNVNIQDLYFTSAISSWNHTLNTGIEGANIELISCITKVGNTYFLTGNVLWDPTVVSGISAATDYLILGPNEVFDGKGYTITITDETNGLFAVSGAVDSSANMPTVKNLNVVSTLDHQGGGIVRANQRFFRVVDCTHTGRIGIDANVATGGAGGIIGYSCATSGGYIHVRGCSSNGLIRKLCGGMTGRFFANGGTGIIERCSSTGGDNTIAFSPPTLESGGIVGHQSGINGGRIEIRDCTSSLVAYYNSGGIISPYAGGNFGGGNGYVLIERCYTTGDIAGINAGGIEGGFSGYGGGTVDISGCYTTGRIVNSGGISGARNAKNNGTLRITNCYTTGHIVCTSNLYFSGGLTGWHTADGGRVEIRNCYALGVVSGPFQSNAGALCAGPVGSLSSGVHGRAYVYNSYGNNHKIFGSISTASSIVRYNATTITSANVASTTGLSSSLLVGSITTTGQVTTGDIANITLWDTTNHWVEGTAETAYLMYQNKNKDGNLRIPATGTLTGVRAVSFWIYISYDTAGFIVDLRDTITNGFFNRGSGIGSNITTYYLNGTQQYIHRSTTDFTLIPVGRWNHLYLELDSAYNATAFMLGSRFNGEIIDAAVSDVAFWSETLTEGEISALYTGEVDIADAKLAYYYSLNNTLNAHTGSTPASVSGTTYWSLGSRRNDMPRLKVFTQGEWDEASYPRFSSSATYLVPIPTPIYGGLSDDGLLERFIFAYDASGNMLSQTPSDGEYVLIDTDISGLGSLDGYNSASETRERLRRSVKLLLEFPNFDLSANRLVIKRTALPFSSSISNEYIEIYDDNTTIVASEVRGRGRGFYARLDEIDKSITITTATSSMNVLRTSDYYYITEGVNTYSLYDGATHIYDDVFIVLGSVTGQPLDLAEPEPEPEPTPPPNYTSLFTTVWTKQAGTTAIDKVFNVAIDSDDNIITTGLTEGDLSGTRVDAWELIVVKFDPSGNQLWAQQLNTGGGLTNVSAGSGVVVDSANNIVVGGYALGDFDGSSNTITYWDYILAKFSPSGSTIWRRQFGQSDMDRLYNGGNIAIDGSDSVYITGQTSDNNIHVYKYDSSGTQLWDVDISSSNGGYEEGTGVAVDSQNNIYVAGSTDGDMSGANAGDFDAVVIKLTTAGEIQWIKQIGNADYNFVHAITCDGSDNVYITGSTYGALPGQTNAGDGDIFIIKLDGDGSILWNRQVGSADYDQATAITTDAYNNVYVVAQTYAAITQDYAGDSDIFIIKYDSAGTEITRAQLGTATEDVPHGIAIDSANHVIITGYSNGTMGDSALGDRDILVIKLAQTDPDDNEYIYPNMFNVRLQADNTLQVEEISGSFITDSELYELSCLTPMHPDLWRNVLSYSDTTTTFNSDYAAEFISSLTTALMGNFNLVGASFTEEAMRPAPISIFFIQYISTILLGDPDLSVLITNKQALISAFDKIPPMMLLSLQSLQLRNKFKEVFAANPLSGSRFSASVGDTLTPFPFVNNDVLIFYINIEPTFNTQSTSAFLTQYTNYKTQSGYGANNIIFKIKLFLLE